ncbi:MAG: hypothetical protein ABL933_02880 [Methyloglobulus sp.]|nr:hypothetical protein [Methyloglobulus sp.]
MQSGRLLAVGGAGDIDGRNVQIVQAKQFAVLGGVRPGLSHARSSG